MVCDSVTVGVTDSANFSQFQLSLQNPTGKCLSLNSALITFYTITEQNTNVMNRKTHTSFLMTSRLSARRSIILDIPAKKYNELIDIFT